MKTLLTSLAIASTAAITLGTASANDTFQVEFDYYRSAPVAKSYARLEKTAATACIREYRRDFFANPSSSIVRDCKAELVAKAIEASDNAELVSFHSSKAGGKAYNAY